MQQSAFEFRRDDLIGQYGVRIEPIHKKYQERLVKCKNAKVKYRVRKRFRSEIKPHLEDLFNQIELAKREVMLMENWRWGKTHWR